MNRIIRKLFIVLLLVLVCGCADNTDNEEIVFPIDARVSYLGPEGTYTQEAAEFFFGDNGEYIAEDSVSRAIDDVIDGISDYAVIPQENTIGGAVTNYLDALIEKNDVYVVGEIILPISQTLMGIEGASLDDIKVVCSHAQGIAQSEVWRKENIPDAVTEEMSSTAAAVSYVAEMGDKSIAAIGASRAGELYGLSILAENVQITDNNKTRFYVLSDSPISRGNHGVFVVQCEANRIDDIIVELNKVGLEFVCIHDRPEGSLLGSYYYVIEVENNSGINKSQLNKLDKFSELRFLGCFDVKEK